MWKATIRGILARRVRLALTALAVVLGVTFVSGTYVLTDTLDRSFNGVFNQTVAGVDLVREEHRLGRGRNAIQSGVVAGNAGDDNQRLRNRNGKDHAFMGDENLTFR